jgi:hypothetical protein
MLAGRKTTDEERERIVGAKRRIRWMPEEFTPGCAPTDVKVIASSTLI